MPVVVLVEVQGVMVVLVVRDFRPLPGCCCCARGVYCGGGVGAGGGAGWCRCWSMIFCHYQTAAVVPVVVSMLVVRVVMMVVVVEALCLQIRPYISHVK